MAVPSFPLGGLVATAGMTHWYSADLKRIPFIFGIVDRHGRGDWGDVDRMDWAINDAAARDDLRILSQYPIPEALRGDAPDDHVWIVTEADRSTTTILFPSEY